MRLNTVGRRSLVTVAPVSSMAVLQYHECFLENQIEVNSLNAPAAPVHRELRIGKQVREQFAHALRAFGDELDASRGFAVELAPIAFHEELRVAGDHPQRFLQIVAGGEGELIEILVHALQLRHVFVEGGLSILPLGDISENKNNTDDIAIGIADRRGAVIDGGFPAIFRCQLRMIGKADNSSPPVKPW